jgi:hypothetical protein
LTVPSIEYWNKNAWSRYMKEDILPFYRSCLTLLELGNSLTELCHGKMLSEVIKKKPTIQDIFLHGTSPPENYDKRGLAYYYLKLMGASVKLREYYFLKGHEREPSTLCTVAKTNVMRYVEHIGELLERILNRAAELSLISMQEINEAKDNCKKKVDEILTEPKILVEKFGEALQNALKTSVANSYTRLIWHLRKIPKKYIKEFYPKILNEETFRFLQELLGLREYIVPRIEDPEIADLYTIFSFDHAITIEFVQTTFGKMPLIDGMSDQPVLYLRGYLPSTTAYPYNSIGGCICRVNEIWGMFNNCRDELALVVEEVPNLLENWKIFSGDQKPRWYWCELEYPKNLQVLSMLDELFPALFYGQLELVLSEDGKTIHVYARW